MMKGKIKDSFAKLLAGFLALALAVTAVPVTGMAAGERAGEGGSSASGIELSKTARLQADGTYTIDLEAYATGTVDIEEVTSGVPCDIVMVLDLSGSMQSGTIPGTATYQALNSKTYTYDNYGSNTYYYKDGDNYYPVSRACDGTEIIPGIWDTRTNFCLSYKKDNVTYYLSGTGTTTTKPTNVGSSAGNIWTGVLYNRVSGGTAQTKLAALQAAAEGFIDNVSENAAKNNVDHRIALVSFGSGYYASSNTEAPRSNYGWYQTGIYTPDGMKKYNANGSMQTCGLTTNDYRSALVAPTTLFLKDSIQAFKTDNNARTYPNYGLEMANGIFNSRSDGDDKYYNQVTGKMEDRKKIVLFFTDGAPGYNGTASSFTDETSVQGQINIANRAITQADALKAGNTTVYSVAIIEDANPKADYNFAVTGSGTRKDYSTKAKAVNAFLHFVSSDYASAGNMETPDHKIVVDRGYYLAANDAEELKDIFTTISGSIDTSHSYTDLDEHAVLRDIISDEFKLPKGFNKDDEKDLKLLTADYLGKDTNGNDVWAEPVKDDKLTAKVPEDKTTIDVTGFSYKENYVGADEKGNYTGKKLIVQINGILPLDTTRGDVTTNNPKSGIYQDENTVTAVDLFEQPKFEIPHTAYVLDYGKTLKAPVSEIVGDNAAALALSHTFSKQDGYTTELLRKKLEDESYNQFGDVELTQMTVKGTDVPAVAYTPKTMNWNGFDTFGVLAKINNVDQYEWSAVSFIPANSVYYEDGFVTDDGDGTVGIVYSGDWKVETNSTEPTEGSGEDTQIADNELTHGWDEMYAGESGYTDGSAHGAMNNTATASFTFTGTGVDVYSRTNMSSGKVLAQLSGRNLTYSKVLVVDGIAESGNYYQIPTVFFNDLEYGTYTLKISVLANNHEETSSEENAANGTYTYYLDGIRVYNPLKQDDNTDSIVKDAYDEANEFNAVFKTVREILLDAKSLGSVSGEQSGVVFLDKVTGVEKPGVESDVVGNYEDFGPKNEVYLKGGQAIAFKTNKAGHYYIGLKAPNGNATTVETTFSDNRTSSEINTTADMYYEIVPNRDGLVIVKNGGANLLAITKLRTTDDADLEPVDVELMLAYADRFDELSWVTPDENPEVVPEENPGDVVIKNPVKEIINIVEKIFDGIKDLFGRK